MTSGILTDSSMNKLSECLYGLKAYARFKRVSFSVESRFITHIKQSGLRKYPILLTSANRFQSRRVDSENN